MALSTNQQVAVGCAFGGIGTVGADMLIRRYADNQIQDPQKAGEEPSLPFLFDKAPIVSIAGGIVAGLGARLLFGSWTPAIAAFGTSAFAGLAPVADEWIQAHREKVEAEEAKSETPPAEGEGEGEGGRGLKAGRYGRLAAGMRGRAGAGLGGRKLSDIAA